MIAASTVEQRNMMLYGGNQRNKVSRSILAEGMPICTRRQLVTVASYKDTLVTTTVGGSWLALKQSMESIPEVTAALALLLAPCSNASVLEQYRPA